MELTQAIKIAQSVLFGEIPDDILLARFAYWRTLCVFGIFTMVSKGKANDAIRKERVMVSDGLVHWAAKLESALPNTAKERIILRVLANLERRLNYCDRALGR